MSNLSYVDLYEDNNTNTNDEPSLYEQAADVVSTYAGKATDAAMLVTTDVYAGTIKTAGRIATTVTQNAKHTKAFFNAGRDQSRDRIAARIAKHLNK